MGRALQCTMPLLCFLAEGLNCTRLKLAKKDVVDSPLSMKVFVMVVSREKICSNLVLAVVTVSFPAPTLLFLQDGILCTKNTWGLRTVIASVEGAPYLPHKTRPQALKVVTRSKRNQRKAKHKRNMSCILKVKSAPSTVKPTQMSTLGSLLDPSALAPILPISLVNPCCM